MQQRAHAVELAGWCVHLAERNAAHASAAVRALVAVSRSAQNQSSKSNPARAAAARVSATSPLSTR
jgi:hypothetical protein